MTTHVIRQQYLHVEMAGTEADGLALQRSLPALCRDWITPAMEAAFDRCAPPDVHLFIDRLEIDAGTISVEHLERDLAQSVAQALEKSLREQIRLYGLRLGAPGGALAQRSPAETADEAFIHFLNTGTFPWWFRLPPGKSLEEVVRSSWQWSETETKRFRPLAGVVSGALASATARKRLVRQFSSLFVNSVLAVLFPQQHLAVQEILETVRGAACPPAILVPLQRELWEICLASSATTSPLTLDVLVVIAMKTLGQTGEHGETVRLLERRWPQESKKVFGRRRLTTTGPSGSAQGDAPVQTAREGKERGRVGSPDFFVEIDAKEGVYIDNAGGVLLHPFLPLFFETVGIAASDKILQPERALCLLHYVITGRTVAPEYELMLLKILCGIDLDAIVEPDVGLTDAERTEAEELLRSVIGHWEALRNTSPDALRGSFLVRPGKVMQRDDEWLLQVEPQTCDILLDQLPWGVSTVKLPWMERILWVEWR
jgi:hypothetical protein